ncbi:hypothetical protein E4T38_00590 [Aureobasidium subglaciale]|nr:hypothetical protein E4T38_00590 [Aureobasidium subglaciale]KAI5231702.1 hypothetical protein E4T40_00313 [Aureobasidium subglaciale]KAI5234440.1 hypothetical protein E4T41_00589 [Aureobasidium subglaciale]KAI5268108.1 hypothetical protein E4T46_00589 [Aureobasidium subglaciale]
MGALDIAQELCNSKFCNAKMLFPQGDLSITAAVEFEAKVFPRIMLEGWLEHVLPFTALILDARGAKYIDESKKSKFGPMDEFRTRMSKQEEETGVLEDANKRAVRPIQDFYEKAEEVGQERKGVFYGGGEEPHCDVGSRGQR